MKKGGTTRAAFAAGGIPRIACFNKATEPLGVDFAKLVRVLQRFVDEAFAPVWGTPAKLIPSTGFLKGAWGMVFLDRADAPGALGYHDLTPQGLPLARVFVKVARANGERVSVTASHELAEMLVDPAINLWSNGPKRGVFYAYETADPVEAHSFEIDGVPMTDFIYPSWFEGFRKSRSTKFDHLGKVTRPFQISRDGYQILWEDGEERQIFGSPAKKRRFEKEDRRGHRSTYRIRPPGRCSAPCWGRPIR